MTPALASPAAVPSAGSRLVSVDGQTLPLTHASLAADARGGLARVTLRQVFANPHDVPLAVTYTLPLPADGAVSGFAFTLGSKRIVGEVDTRQQARQRFEDAVLEGRTAALLDQERTSLFTQELGNVPPRTQVECEVTIDQPLQWLPDGLWEWRFPTVVAPRYLGAPGRVADAAKVAVDVADRALPVSLSLALSIRDGLAEGARPQSPSHVLHAARGEGRFDVSFAEERGVALDRDVVVRWPVAGLTVGAGLDVARSFRDAISGSAFGLLTLVPPSPEVKAPAVPRDLIVLLDTSGSMGGEPLDQARRVTSALVDGLGDDDSLELIEFSNSPRRWQPAAVKATAAQRRAALAWLQKLRASGGTEMASGILEALQPLRAGAQRQVVLITDGLIGSEHEVLSAIAQRLPAGCRVHTVGVGSGVNRSLTQPAARAGRGVELVVGLGEDAEVLVKRLLPRIERPLVTEVEVSGSAVEGVAPARLPDLYAGAPSLVSVKLSAMGGTLVLRGRTADGAFEQVLPVTPTERGAGAQAVTALYARAKVEDLELNIATGQPRTAAEREIEATGLAFQVSTRLTSWVAATEEVTVDPRAPRRQATMPHELAYGLSAEGVGLRPAAPSPLPVQVAASLVPQAPAGAAFGLLGGLGAGGGAPVPPARMRSAAPMAEKKAEKADVSKGKVDDEAAPVMTRYFQEALVPPALPAEEITGSRAAPSAPPPAKSAAPASPPREPEAKRKSRSLVDLVKDAFSPRREESRQAVAPSGARSAGCAPPPGGPAGLADPANGGGGGGRRRAPVLEAWRQRPGALRGRHRDALHRRRLVNHRAGRLRRRADGAAGAAGARGAAGAARGGAGERRRAAGHLAVGCPARCPTRPPSWPPSAPETRRPLAASSPAPSCPCAAPCAPSRRWWTWRPWCRRPSCASGRWRRASCPTAGRTRCCASP